MYSPDLCLELDDLPRVPFDMIKSEPIAEAENEIENSEKKEGTEDGNVQGQLFLNFWKNKEFFFWNDEF